LEELLFRQVLRLGNMKQSN